MPGYVVQVRRVYDQALASDGARVLVDRLWPRGVSKEKAHLDEWLKDVAPSPELREWYGHVPERFAEFSSQYEAELRSGEQATAIEHLRMLVASGPVTLLTATKEPEISEAAVLEHLLRT